MIKYTYSSCLNLGNSSGFDAFFHNNLTNTFCLSDGANSFHKSGLAAQYATTQLCDSFLNSIDEVYSCYKRINDLINEKYPGAACTTAHIQLNEEKFLISSCGDTLIEIYELTEFRLPLFKKNYWRLNWKNTLDELETIDGPSQLLGSNAYREANIYSAKPNGSYLILLSTDGLHRYTEASERSQYINQIKKENPSEYDLEYICQSLAQLALKKGSKDDISIAAIWCNAHKDLT